MEIVAHRGNWNVPAEKNTSSAMDRAIDSGFGIETDVRDYHGSLAISHDVPDRQPAVFVQELFAKWSKHRQGVLAINVKADGLQALLADAVRVNNLRDYFFFDMSIPDSIGYLKHDLPIFTRHSDLEPQPSLYEEAEGVWLDAFHTDWWGSRTIEAHLHAGKRVCVVSPELHGRPHAAAWEILARASWKTNPNIMLCTDYPQLAAEEFR